MHDTPTHESQPERERAPVNVYLDEQLAPQQRIEGGGPPKPIVFGTLPRPLRIFGYGFIAALVLMTAAVIISSMLK